MKTMKSRFVLVLLTACLLIAAGCQTDQAGVTHSAGTIKATLSASPAAVTEAAEEVLEDKDFVIVSANSTAIDGRVIARTALDVKVRVDSKKVGDDISQVVIKVGSVMGDKDLGLSILTEIKEELGLPTHVEDDDDEDEDEDEDEDDDDDDDDDDEEDEDDADDEDE